MFEGSKKLRSEGRKGGVAQQDLGRGWDGEGQTTHLISMFLIFQTHLYSSSQFLSVCLRAVRSCAVKTGSVGGTAKYTEGVGGGEARADH